MSFVFEAPSAGVLLYREEVSLRVRGLLIALGLALLAGGVALAAALLFRTASALATGLVLLCCVALVVLGGFLLRIGLLAAARSIRFDAGAGRAECHARALLGRPRRTSYPYSELRAVEVVRREMEGSLPDYTVEILTQAGERISCLGFWEVPEEAEAWAGRLRQNLGIGASGAGAR